MGKPCPKQIPHPLVSGGDPVFRGLGRSIRVPRVERGRGIVLDAGLFREHPQLRDGHLQLGEKPGFGLEVDWAFVDKYRIRP